MIFDVGNESNFKTSDDVPNQLDDLSANIPAKHPSADVPDPNLILDDPPWKVIVDEEPSVDVLNQTLNLDEPPRSIKAT